MHTSYYIAPTSGTGLRTKQQNLNTFPNRNIKMSLLNSPASSQLDLYDQDNYSIPDDELRSVNSSTISIEGTDDNSLAHQADLHQESIAHNSCASNPTMNSETDRSNTLEWTTLTSRKHQAAAKKHKIAEPRLHFDPSLSDRDLPHFRGRKMEDVQDALKQGMKDDMSDDTSSSYRRRVPVTTLATEDDFKFGESSRKKTPEVPSSRGNSGVEITTDQARNNGSLKKIHQSTKHTVRITESHPKKLSANHTKGPSTTSLASTVTTQVLPTEKVNLESSSTIFYTYRAQLTFGLSPSPSGVNVAQYFRRWIFSSCASIDNFSLIPYDDEKGQQVNNIDQVPDENKEFYSTYYHNHRILNQGNLTGMVAFQCSTPWAQLKSPNHPYFAWLKMNKVFINQTKFKTSSLVPCGFLLGAHPGHLRRDEAESELKVSLGYDNDDEVTFQLSSRSVSVPIQEGKPERYAFQAVVVETSTQQASTLREKFFSLGNPTQAQNRFPYTGKYQFVPFLKTQEWTVEKILRLAKLHVKIVQDLKAIFIKNLKDIHNTINDDGTTLLQGFYGMTFTPPPPVTGETPTSVPLLHSIHNTGKSTTKVALVPSYHYEAANTQLSAIHSILASYIPPAYHECVFIESLQAGITGQQIDSISSCNSAAYATELLNRYNPQDGEEVEEPQQLKRFRQVPMSYAAATVNEANPDAQTVSSKATVSSITSADLDQLYEKMKTYIGDTATSEINIDDLESRMAKSTREIQEVREQLTTTVSSITTRVDTLSADIKLHTDQMASEIKRQNIIILGMQQQFQDSMSDFAIKLQALYNHPGTTIQPFTPTTTTSEQRRRGDEKK